MNKTLVSLCYIVTFFVHIAVSFENHLHSKYEVWRLPEENLGIAGLSFQHDLTSKIALGPEAWMAVYGKRGGFITLGIDGSYNTQFSKYLSMYYGLFVGAGGGNGGYFLSGGGLMIRPHVSLSYLVNDNLEIYAGYSYVSFPNGGIIDSSQPFIQLSIPLDKHISFSEKKKISLAPLIRNIHPTDGSRTTSNRVQKKYNLIGIEAKSYFNELSYMKLETEGAAGGDSSGFMQILVGVGVEAPLSRRLYFHTDISMGGGGGGAVETGGGLLLDSGLGFVYYLGPNIFLGASAGYMHAPDGELEAVSSSFKLGYSMLPYNAERVGLIKHSRIRFVHQTYLQANDDWRVHHSDLNVGNLGLQLDAFLNNDWYLTGQGIAAESGQAGAYMTGLLGVGKEIDLENKWFVLAEALLGAAGGGGLQTGSGFVHQANLGLGYRFKKDVAFMLLGGRMESFDGPFTANVAGLSLNCDFNIFK